MYDLNGKEKIDHVVVLVNL